MIKPITLLCLLSSVALAVPPSPPSSSSPPLSLPRVQASHHVRGDASLLLSLPSSSLDRVIDPGFLAPREKDSAPESSSGTWDSLESGPFSGFSSDFSSGSFASSDPSSVLEGQDDFLMGYNVVSPPLKMGYFFSSENGRIWKIIHALQQDGLAPDARDALLKAFVFSVHQFARIYPFSVEAQDRINQKILEIGTKEAHFLARLFMIASGVPQVVFDGFEGDDISKALQLILNGRREFFGSDFGIDGKIVLEPSYSSGSLRGHWIVSQGRQIYFLKLIYAAEAQQLSWVNQRFGMKMSSFVDGPRIALAEQIFSFVLGGRRVFAALLHKARAEPTSYFERRYFEEYGRESVRGEILQDYFEMGRQLAIFNNRGFAHGDAHGENVRFNPHRKRLWFIDTETLAYSLLQQTVHPSLREKIFRYTQRGATDPLYFMDVELNYLMNTRSKHREKIVPLFKSFIEGYLSQITDEEQRVSLREKMLEMLVVHTGLS